MMDGKKVLVAGAGGFIGGNLCKDLQKKGYWVRGVDIKNHDFFEKVGDEFKILDLRNYDNCLKACDSIDEVYQLAADMGGIGYITTNHAKIFRNNALINLNMLEAARQKKVKNFLYSSSACIYPQYLQKEPDIKPLKESDAYPADAEPGYGWEKLFSELANQYYHKDFGLKTHIVRFHNIYGPYGTYSGGKEKAPAALCRKVATAEDDKLEIWGDGQQTRSFCFINDCVKGLQKIMESDYYEPLNLGTDVMVTINELAEIIMEIAGKKLEIIHIKGPQGVRGRNSDNSLLRDVLGWEPEVSLKEGLRETYCWIEKQVKEEREMMGSCK
ncbi:MAG: NAD-dependent epimerase/dehydratase family protein [Phycisphaerales bacterium]|jgi:nucleoside-diphosphate-sugar epimerase